MSAANYPAIYAYRHSERSVGIQIHVFVAIHIFFERARRKPWILTPQGGSG